MAGGHKITLMFDQRNMTLKLFEITFRKGVFIISALPKSKRWKTKDFEWGWSPLHFT